MLLLEDDVGLRYKVLLWRNCIVSCWFGSVLSRRQIESAELWLYQEQERSMGGEKEAFAPGKCPMENPIMEHKGYRYTKPTVPTYCRCGPIGH
jgi:hypothetical protein